MAPRKREGHPSFGGASFKFDPSVDSGPLDPRSSVEEQEVIQKERIRRQVQSHTFGKPGGKGSR